MPWYTTQPGHRSLTVSDRLPDIHLSQTGPLNAPLATRPSRGASFDSSSNHSNSAPSLTSSYSSIDTGLGIKTPPSAGSPEASSVLFSKDQPQYFQEAAYSGSMNQSHPYMDNQHPHLTSGPSYAPHQQTSGMSHYQYPTQASTAYAPAQSSYGQYYGGVTSPHPVGHPVSVSMGTQLLPLPSECSFVPREGIEASTYRAHCSSNPAAWMLTIHSNGRNSPSPTFLRRSWRPCSRLFSRKLRHDRPSRASRRQAPCHRDFVGR